MREVYEILEWLESQAVWTLARRLDREPFLAELRQLNNEMRTALTTGDMPAWAKANDQFHIRLVAAAGNGRLSRICENLLDQSQRVRAFTLRLRESPTGTGARTGNPMISVYDGHPAGVGRVASDSTWHHWMDVNIDNMRAADNNDWKKISRYFINLAVWLSPPGFSTRCFYVSVVASHFQTPGFQEYMPKATVLELGRSLRAHLTFYYGPCWVTDRIWELIWFKKLLPFELLREPRRPKLDIDSIDPDLIEDLLLGHMVKATMDSANAVKAAVAEGKSRVETRLDPPDKAVDRPLQAAITELGEGLREHFELGAKLAAALR